MEKDPQIEKTIATTVSASTRLKLKYITILIIALCAIALVYYLRGVLAPFVGAFLIAYVVNPVVDKIEFWVRLCLRKPRFSAVPKRVARIVATLATLLLMCLAITVFCLIFIPQVTAECSRFVTLVKKFMSDSAWLQPVLSIVPSDWRAELQNMTVGTELVNTLQSIDFWETLQSMIAKLLPGALGVLSGTATVVLTLVSIVFIAMYTTFLMLDMPKITRKVRILIPLESDDRPDILRKTNLLMKAYFRSQSLVAFIVGGLYAVSFAVIGFPMGIAFGMFIGILNMVPYLQAASMPIAAFLGIIYSLDTGMPYWQVLLVITAIYLIIQIVEDMLIIPRIVGTEMNLPPVLILLSISVWGKLLGFIGLVCAIPFTCIVIAIFQQYVEHRLFPRRRREEVVPKGREVP